jgi:N-acetylneuraminate synthase/N,N'-diacetyllegionaminate synthase
VEPRVSVVPADRCFLICEAGVTNYGEIELARRQVDVAAEAGVDAIKFQAWDTAALVSKREAARLQDELGYDWFARMEERRLDWDELRELKAYAKEKGLLFFAAAHDETGLRFLVEELDVPLLKIGSGEAANERFVRQVGETGKPVLISFGLQTDAEVLRAVEILREAGTEEIVAFHCVSVYPTPYALVDLERMDRLRDLLGVPVGLSDHSVGSHVCLAAVARGAAAIEKHLTFDKADPRSLDNPGAFEPDELVAFTRQARELETALRPPPEAELAEALARARDWATQAIVAARALPVGHVLTDADLALKRPARGGLPPAALADVVGRRLTRELAVDEQLQPSDLMRADA